MEKEGKSKKKKKVGFNELESDQNIEKNKWSQILVL